MKFYLFLLVAIAATEALNDIEQWTLFKEKYDKSYKNEIEEKTRFTAFQNNLRKIEEHNEKFSNGMASFKLGINKFADLTAEEFLQKLKLSYGPTTDGERYTEKLDDVDVTRHTAFDWRPRGAVTPVKTQGDCGSCWTFSTTGTIEGAYFISSGNLISLSEQNLLDCAYDKCFGCEGGLMYKALESVISRGGIMSEDDYPYRALEDHCRFNSSKAAVKVSNFTYVAQGDELELQKVVAFKGPVSVSIEATFYYQLYESGILDDKTCRSEQEYSNHGVLIVGYGILNETEYWIIKNSWGVDWGLNGYIWMSRNKNNQCGIATTAIYPTIES